MLETKVGDDVGGAALIGWVFVDQAQVYYSCARYMYERLWTSSNCIFRWGSLWHTSKP